MTFVWGKIRRDRQHHLWIYHSRGYGNRSWVRKCTQVPVYIADIYECCHRIERITEVLQSKVCKRCLEHWAILKLEESVS